MILTAVVAGALLGGALVWHHHRRRITVLWGAPPRILRDGRVIGFVCPTCHRAVFHAEPCRRCAR